MVQAVEHLPNKYEALRSNKPQYCLKIKKERKLRLREFKQVFWDHTAS
jgi:hypothetical protein